MAIGEMPSTSSLLSDPNSNEALSKTVSDLQKSIDLLMQALMKQSGGASPMGGGSDPQSQYLDFLRKMMQPQGGTISNPLAGSAMMQSTLPGPGPVQWLGGMPPGYDDNVAKKLSQSANAGNILSNFSNQSQYGGDTFMDAIKNLLSSIHR